MHPHVIALIAPSGSGKDCFYQHCESLLPSLDTPLRSTLRASYADELKFELVDAFGPPCSLAVMNDRETKEQWRPLMKTWSQTRKEQCGDSYWAQRLDPLWHDSYWNPTLVVITDLSFQIEKDILESRVPRSHITYVRLVRIDDEYRMPDPQSSPSDWGRWRLPVDQIYLNDKTPQCMDSIVKDVLESIKP